MVTVSSTSRSASRYMVPRRYGGVPGAGAGAGTSRHGSGRREVVLISSNARGSPSGTGSTESRSSRGRVDGQRQRTEGRGVARGPDWHSRRGAPAHARGVRWGASARSETARLRPWSNARLRRWTPLRILTVVKQKYPPAGNGRRSRSDPPCAVRSLQG
jgi:hypothetical protein